MIDRCEGDREGIATTNEGDDMKRTRLCLSVLVLVCLAFGTLVMNAEPLLQRVEAAFGIAVYANGERLASEGVIIDGTTYLPVRALATALGQETVWDPEARTVTLYRMDDDAEKELAGEKDAAAGEPDDEREGSAGEALNPGGLSDLPDRGEKGERSNPYRIGETASYITDYFRHYGAEITIEDVYRGDEARFIIEDSLQRELEGIDFDLIELVLIRTKVKVLSAPENGTLQLNQFVFYDQDYTPYGTGYALGDLEFVPPLGSGEEASGWSIGQIIKDSDFHFSMGELDRAVWFSALD